MWMTNFWKPSFLETIKSPRHRLAWAIAIAADALQIGAFPFFAEGGISPLDTGLDVIVAVALTRVLGWHWAFLPTLAAELVPGADLFPTWTAAVWFVTRQQVKTNNNSSSSSNDPEILPPGPAPAPRR